MSVLVFLAVGVVAGLVARTLVSGKHALGVVGLCALGVIGAFIGGAAGSLVRGDGDMTDFAPSDFIWSTLGAMVVLLVAALLKRSFNRRERYRYRYR